MRRWQVLALALLCVSVSVVFAVWWISTPSRPKVPAPLRDQLGARVVTALEHDPTFRTEVTREPGPWPVCVASVFGVAPDWADTVDDVRTIYTWVECLWLRQADVAKGPTGVDLSQLPGLVMPIAVRLGPPLRYQAPEDGEGHPDSIRGIFPKSLEAAAFSHPDPPVRDALRQRVLQAVGSSTPSPSPSHS